jgi:hypothetical protein
MKTIIKLSEATIIILLILYFAFSAPTDPDLGSHLRYGESILQQKTIPYTEFLSYANLGTPYLPHEWLFEVFTYLIYKNFSLLGLTIFSLAIVFASFYFLINTFEKSLFKLLIVFFTAVIASPIIVGGIRPQLMTIFCISYLFFSLTKLERGERKFFLFLPVVFLVWANTHASFIGGLAILGFYFLDQLMRLTLKKKINQKTSFLVFVTIATVTASFFTPFSFSLIDAFVVLTKQIVLPSFWLGQGTEANLAKTNVLEWMPPFFLVFPGATLLIFILITGITFAFYIRKFSLWEILTIILWSYLAGVSRRHMAFFAFAVCPIVILKYERMNSDKFFRLNQKVLLVILISVLLILGKNVHQNSMTTLKIVLDEKEYFRAKTSPISAVEYLRANPLQGNMFNYYNWGGFLNWQYPQSQVFIDGRLPQSKYLVDYLRIIKTEDDWYETLNSYDVSWVIMPAPARMVTRLVSEKGWKKVYEDILTAVVVRPDR